MYCCVQEAAAKVRKYPSIHECKRTRSLTTYMHGIWHAHADTAFPTGVYVTDVTATSANVHWRAEGQRRGRGKGRVVEYEVICAGLRRYTTASGECDLDTDSVVRSVPEGQNHVFLGPLRPNFNYSCAVLAESTSGALSNSVPCFFSTDYGGIVIIIKYRLHDYYESYCDTRH